MICEVNRNCSIIILVHMGQKLVSAEVSALTQGRGLACSVAKPVHTLRATKVPQAIELVPVVKK